MSLLETGKRNFTSIGIKGSKKGLYVDSTVAKNKGHSKGFNRLHNIFQCPKKDRRHQLTSLSSIGIAQVVITMSCSREGYL